MKTQLFSRLLPRPGALFWAFCALAALPLAGAPAGPARANPVAPAPAAAGDTVRINCGGGAVLAAGGQAFAADAYFTGGKSFANPAIVDVLQTDDDELYRTEHSATANLLPFSYNIPAGAGTYTVRLHFAELYFGATGGGPGGSGKRVFNVNLEGSAVLVNFDITAAAGGAMTAVVKEFQTAVADGALTLDFTASVDEPSVAAIEVIKTGGAPAASCAWQPGAPGPVERKEGQSAAVDGVLYTFGGYYSTLRGANLAQRYDPATNQWASLAPMPYAVSHIGAAVVGKQVWLMGGFVGDYPGTVTAAVQVYDTQTNTWALGPPLPAPRGSGAGALVGRTLHFFGGLLPDRQTDAADHYVLDVDNPAAGWQTAAPLPEPRNHLGGAAVGGKVYAIGGQYGHDRSVADVALLHAYDPATNAWARLSDLPVLRSHFEPSTIVLDGQILIAGGTDNAVYYADILRYDAEANRWSTFCEMPGPLVAPFAAVIGSRLIVTQGARDNVAVPDKATYVSPVVRSPSSVLRFSVPQLAVQLAPGGTATVKNLLWTYSGTAAYALALSNAPAWLALPARTGAAGPLGQDVPLQISAAGLAPGTYTAVVQATAPGYAVATATVTLTVVGPGPVVFAVNAGGGAYTAADNTAFQADQAFSGGATYRTAAPIAGTADDALYQTERYGNFGYAVPVPNGAYRVTFKLAEIYWAGPRQRLFDVLAEGQTVISNLDVYAQAGANTALDIDRTVTVADGVLNLQFRTSADNAKLAALVVHAAGPQAQAEAAALARAAAARKLPKTWNLFPNPAAEKATLSFDAAAAQPARVEVLNSQAAVVWRGAQPAAAGRNALEVPTRQLAPGSYVVRVCLLEGVISEKVLVVR